MFALLKSIIAFIRDFDEINQAFLEDEDRILHDPS